MSTTEILAKIFKKIDEKSDYFVENLANAVAIKNVSSWLFTHSDEMNKMINIVESRLKSLGATTNRVKIGHIEMPQGRVELPDLLLGEITVDEKLPTVLIYGHLDVQPADKVEDGWNTEPFQLVQIEGNLFGRGSTDDKGPVLGWLNAIEAIQEVGSKLPVNLKFVFESMEEYGSEGLDEALFSMKDSDFIKKVDFVVISDNYWLGREKPCLTYGLRGIIYFYLEVVGAARDLHSGIYGGSVCEALVDCVKLMATLVNHHGAILVPEIYDAVRPLTAEEDKIYDQIHFDLEEYRQEIGCTKLIHNSCKKKTLQNRWRNPSLSFHGVEGAYSQPGAKTVIPKKVVGKFSVRLVPDQDPDTIVDLVTRHIEKAHSESGSHNSIKVLAPNKGKPWMAKPGTCLSYRAGRAALNQVWGLEPDLTREGGSIPVTLTFQELTGKSVMLLPMGQSDDGAHSQNEKLSRNNYIQGTKVMAAYFYHLAELCRSTQL